jgi:predicted RNA-binding Zn-ribbon protein involved in translation (DUF1610 family)
MRESDWYGINVCVKCEGRLKYSQKMYSDGVCPKCGHVTIGTICETNKVIIKEIKHHEWWQFWKRKFTYKGKDDFSERWLNKH